VRQPALDAEHPGQEAGEGAQLGAQPPGAAGAVLGAQDLLDNLADPLGRLGGLQVGDQLRLLPIGDNRDELVASKRRTREVYAQIAADLRASTS